MLDIGWGDFMVLVLAALFVLGPERLPGAAAQLGRTVRQIRTYASSAQAQLKSELGADFEELREPLESLRELRNFDPKRTLTRHLLDPTSDDGAPYDTDAT
jgi:sec-independent protein translocase protein TatB